MKRLQSYFWTDASRKQNIVQFHYTFDNFVSMFLYVYLSCVVIFLFSNYDLWLVFAQKWQPGELSLLKDGLWLLAGPPPSHRLQGVAGEGYNVHTTQFFTSIQDYLGCLLTEVLFGFYRVSHFTVPWYMSFRGAAGGSVRRMCFVSKWSFKKSMLKTDAKILILARG